MLFKFPDSELDNDGSIIKLKKILSRENLIKFYIEGYPEYRITYKLDINKAFLIGPRSKPLLREQWRFKSQRYKLTKDYERRVVPINLEEEIDYLPEAIRDFILFNLDLFA